jgi:hypothetical protein
LSWRIAETVRIFGRRFDFRHRILTAAGSYGNAGGIDILSPVNAYRAIRRATDKVIDHDDLMA